MFGWRKDAPRPAADEPTVRLLCRYEAGMMAGEWTRGSQELLGLIAALTHVSGPEVGLLDPIEVEGEMQVILFRVTLGARNELCRRLFETEKGIGILAGPSLNGLVWQAPIATAASKCNLVAAWNKTAAVPILAGYVSEFLGQAVPTLHETRVYVALVRINPAAERKDEFASAIKGARERVGDIPCDLALLALEAAREFADE